MATTRVHPVMAATFCILLLGMGSPLVALAEDESAAAPADLPAKDAAGDKIAGPASDADSSSPEPTAADARTQLTALGFSGQPFATAEQLTNLAENSTPKSEYDRCYQVIAEDGKDDGRGYTCYGLVGVTTKNGDALEMVERYTAERHDNPLAKYLPVMSVKADDNTSDAERGSLEGLEGFPEAWAAAAKDPAFRQVQDDIRDQRFTGPALDAVQQVGLRTNLGFASMYDASVMHGSSTDPSDPEYGDSLNALVQRATDKAGGTPASGKVTEAQWLKSFYDVREADLRNPVNKDTQSVWSEAVDRVEVYRKLLQQGNTELRRPLKVRVNGDNFRLE